MPPLLRNVLAVIAGLIVGMLANGAIVLLMMVLYPLPEGTDPMNSEQMKVALADMPATAWLLAIVAHLLQAFVGGWVAARLGASKPVVLALIVGALSLAGGIMNAINLEPPTWVWLEMPLYLVVAWIAGTIEAKRRARLAG